ncbi:MAG: MerR family transcriptional regulator [Lachnospiraceae bacterium]|nr:MerR family transcriptional regulator [Lachnospiraceae bacterium]
MTVNEVSKLTGVSIRTLHYYDQIELLQPTGITESGYRQYDDTALERLQQILLFRELEFPLKEIKKILDSDGFDRKKALEQQIELLTLKKEHLENLITFAREIKRTGVRTMDFKVFDKSKMDEYAKKAKEQWGDTEAYKEFEQKNKERSGSDMKHITRGLMQVFAEFGEMMDKKADDELVQGLVKKLQDYISTHFYQCTPEILRGLGKMYAGGGEFTENIDAVGGEGCAKFAADAIEIYCSK